MHHALQHPSRRRSTSPAVVLAGALAALALVPPAAAQGPPPGIPAPPRPPAPPAKTTEILDELVAPWSQETRPQLLPDVVGHVPIPPSTLLVEALGPNRLPAFYYTWTNLVDYPVAIGLTFDECYSVRWGSTAVGLAPDAFKHGLPSSAKNIRPGTVYLVAGLAGSEGASHSEGDFTPELYGATRARQYDQSFIRERAMMRQLFRATTAVKPLRQYDMHPTVELVIPPRGELSVCLYAERIHPRMESPLVSIEGVKVATRGDSRPLDEIVASVQRGNYLGDDLDDAWLAERERTVEHRAQLHARHYALDPGGDFDARAREAERSYRATLEHDRERRRRELAPGQLARFRQEERVLWAHQMQGWLLPEPVPEYRVVRTLPRMPLRHAFRAHGFDQQYVGFVLKEEDGSFIGRAFAFREGQEPEEVSMEFLNLMIFEGEWIGFGMTRELDRDLAKGLDALTRADLDRFTEHLLRRQTGLEDVSEVFESLQKVAELALATRGYADLR